jgi:hypothetical protein
LDDAYVLLAGGVKPPLKAYHSTRGGGKIAHVLGWEREGREYYVIALLFMFIFLLVLKAPS